MSEEDTGQVSGRAEAFFERARKVAETDNFDYAIDMYLEGLRCAPDAVEQGHISLHELALARQVKGGKRPSIVEKVKLLRGKTALERMLNAEELFAKNPDHLPYAEGILKAAVSGGYKKTAQWIADLLFQANNAVSKPSLQTYLLLKDSYLAIGLLERAVVACQFAAELEPEKEEVADEYQRLSAELTVSRGKYDVDGDFRQSIRDREVQEKLQSQEKIIKTADYRVSAVEDARKALAAEPNLPMNIFNLANALSDMEADEAENEAMELLEDAYERKSDFSFKQRAGKIRIQQLRRKVKEAKSVVEGGGDEQAKSAVAELSGQLDDFELEHYRLCVQNYPTDLRAKYEYGVRLLGNEQYDDAIPLLQEARREPRHRITAMDKIGLSFFMKGWFADAVDIFTQAIESYNIKDDDIAKELRYNLGRACEEQGEVEKALEIFRKIAQLDFAYKDVHQRVDKLRNK